MPSHLTRLLLLLSVTGLAACGQESPAPTAATVDRAPEATAGQEAASVLPRSAAPEGARVFFITPADGDTVTSPVTIEFGVEGMTIAPAGVEQAASGHHHLIVDAELPDPGDLPPLDELPDLPDLPEDAA